MLLLLYTDLAILASQFYSYIYLRFFIQLLMLLLHTLFNILEVTGYIDFNGARIEASAFNSFYFKTRKTCQ